MFQIGEFEVHTGALRIQLCTHKKFQCWEIVAMEYRTARVSRQRGELASRRMWKAGRSSIVDFPNLVDSHRRERPKLGHDRELLDHILVHARRTVGSELVSGHALVDVTGAFHARNVSDTRKRGTVDSKRRSTVERDRTSTA